jgi:CRP/FNR family cyclic AMP-dependent transcriptional regulator
MREMISFLARTEVFKGFTEGEIEKFAGICESAYFEGGEVIVEEDALERDLYIIRSGRVKITLANPQGRHLRASITSCCEGQVFGELAFIDGARRSTWVVAADDVDAIRISWEDFRRLIQGEPEMAYRFIYNLALVIADRLRDTTMFCSNLLGVR